MWYFSPSLPRPSGRSCWWELCGGRGKEEEGGEEEAGGRKERRERKKNDEPDETARKGVRCNTARAIKQEQS